MLLSDMAITDEKIASLKREYTSKIEDALKQAEVWNGVVAQFKIKLDVLNDLVIGANGASTPQQRSLGAPVGKYANMETTPAVLAVLDSATEPLPTSDIIKILENEGFNTTSQHWKAAVFTACKRLVERGKIQEFQRDKKKAFMRKV
jgi:hypothetical protein